MFRLTREVRFAINQAPDPQLSEKPTNSYGGFPTVTGFGPHLTLEVTIAGELDEASNYLVNIKNIDAAVRQRAVPKVAAAVEQRVAPTTTAQDLYDLLIAQWPPLSVD